jgi:hypothetical protein
MANCPPPLPPIRPDTTVVVAGRAGHRGTGGRYHRTELCWTIHKGAKRRLMTAFFAAEAGYYPCPYCAAEPPLCCRTGDHAHHTLALPVLAPPEAPDWERELELAEVEPDG